MDVASRESAPLLTRKERWGPWTTLAWAAGAALVMIASQTAGAVLYLASLGLLQPERPINPQELQSNGALLATAFLISTPLVLAYLFVAVRLARVPFREYMALKWPSWRALLVGIGALAGVLLLAGAGAVITGQEMPDFMADTFRTARDAGMLPLFFFSFAVLAPVQEELIFRGFLFRGLAPALGPWITIVLTAAVWAVIHMQYQWFFLGEIFLLGVAFGWLRWRSDSTILTMLLHGSMNAMALAQAGLMAG
jgi:uncharacterized protein